MISVHILDGKYNTPGMALVDSEYTQSCCGSERILALLPAGPLAKGQRGGAAQSKEINNRRGRLPADLDSAMDSSTSRTRRSRVGNSRNTAGNRTDRCRVDN